MDREAWRAVIHGVTKSRTRLSDWIELNWTEMNWRSFLYSSSVYSCHLFLISSASLRSIPFLFLLCSSMQLIYGEGNGNLLQCSCLENSRDGEAWWAAFYGVAQSRTWLKQLSSSSSMVSLISDLGWPLWNECCSTDLLQLVGKTWLFLQKLYYTP